MKFVSSLSVLLLSGVAALAWDYEGHRFVNQIAVASLPANFPAFDVTPEVEERIAFLAGEPDRWRNTSDLPLKHFNGPDHYIDIDDLPLYGLSPEKLSSFRYEMTAQLALARAQHSTNFPAIDSKKNEDKTRELVGFLPWTIEEYYAKLKSAFSYLKTFEEFGSPEEIINAQQNAIYIMGTMGHFIGDAGQPLHTTKHYNGWVGENPKGYTTSNTFHSLIDGGYIKRAGINLEELKKRVRPSQVLAEAKHFLLSPRATQSRAKNRSKKNLRTFLPSVTRRLVSNFRHHLHRLLARVKPRIHLG